MLGKMLIHGLVAATVIGSAAAVYAQAKDNGYLSPATTAEQQRGFVAETNSGTLRPAEANVGGREGERRQGVRSERHREHDHDNDDD